MNNDIKKHIESIKAKLQAENINVNDFKKCVDVLSRCCSPVYCIRIYKDYIYNYNS